MNWLRQLLFRLQLLFWRAKIETDLDDEIRIHLDMATEANIAAGMSPEEARYAAHRQFGGVAQIKEQYRDQRGVRWVDELARDIQFAARILRNSPGFTTVAVLTLALGISVTTTTFSYLDATMFRRLPYPQPDSLFYLPFPQAPADLVDVKIQNEVFTKFAIFGSPYFNVTVSGELPERVSGFTVSRDFFSIMGVPPLLGRFFNAEEDQPGRDDVIILSYQYWMRRFAGDPSIVGKPLRLDGGLVTVVGVMPEQFDCPRLWGSLDLWRPLAMPETVAKVRGNYYLRAIARLKPGVSSKQAQANLNAIAARLGHDYPLTKSRRRFFLFQVGTLGASYEQRFYWMLIALAGSVLIISCANLANLQLARCSRRAREYAVRIALGASRLRLLRQMLTESLMLSLFGGAFGVIGAHFADQILTSRLAKFFEQPDFRLSMDARVLGLALITTVATSAIFGIVPAWLSSQVDVNAGLKQAGYRVTGDRSRHRLRQTLIVLELSLTLVLLAGAGYMILGIRLVTQRTFEWRMDHLITARVALPYNRYGDVGKCAAFYDHVNEELAAVPGVEQSVVCDSLPILGFYNTQPVVAERTNLPTAGEPPNAYVNPVTPGYFEALGMKMLKGRNFYAADRIGAPAVVIVDRTLAQQFWPNENALGKRIGGSDPLKRDWMEVVGVVDEVSFRLDPTPWTHLQIYRPIAQTGGNYFYVFAHTSVAPESLADALRRAVRRADPDQAVYRVASSEQIVAHNGDGNALLTNSLLFMAVSGLLLSSLGLYGVIANLVAERTAEIGIRIALGAKLRGVVWLVLSQGARLAAIGVLLGLSGAWALARVLGSLTPGHVSQYPQVVAECSLLLFTVALLACWLPARRAARVDPIQALRAE
jgi:putative ABC transport system permease protein